jgi:hypothetical protein
MRQQRDKFPTVVMATLCTVACCCVAPAAASAGSLLSGYGGPGEGQQEILGATLLNGPSGGHGGSGGGGATSSGAGSEGEPRPAGSEDQAGAGSGGRTASRSGATGPAGSAHTSAAGAGHRGGTETTAQQASRARSAPPARPFSYADTAASHPLGLSGEDVVYIILALGALALTGLLTRQLARRPWQDG